MVAEGGSLLNKENGGALSKNVQGANGANEAIVSPGESPEGPMVSGDLNVDKSLQDLESIYGIKDNSMIHLQMS